MWTSSGILSNLGSASGVSDCASGTADSTTGALVGLSEDIIIISLQNIRTNKYVLFN
jgi:hypothetical protein